jgi:hypothetical protein
MVPDCNRIQFGRESSSVIPGPHPPGAQCQTVRVQEARIWAAGSEHPKSENDRHRSLPSPIWSPPGDEQESPSQWNDLFVRGGTATATRTRFLLPVCTSDAAALYRLRFSVAIRWHWKSLRNSGDEPKIPQRTWIRRGGPLCLALQDARFTRPSSDIHLQESTEFRRFRSPHIDGLLIQAGSLGAVSSFTILQATGRRWRLVPSIERSRTICLMFLSMHVLMRRRKRDRRLIVVIEVFLANASTVCFAHGNYCCVGAEQRHQKNNRQLTFVE